MLVYTTTLTTTMVYNIARNKHVATTIVYYKYSFFITKRKKKRLVRPVAATHVTTSEFDPAVNRARNTFMRFARCPSFGTTMPFSRALSFAEISSPSIVTVR